MRTTLIAVVATLLIAGGFAAKAEARNTANTSIYAKWTQGPSTDPNFFPIAVWAQNPRDAGKYKAIGVNTYMALHGGPTEKQLTTLAKYGVKAICHQNKLGLDHKNNPTIIAWMHGDEPDNFKRENGKWAKAVPTAKIIEDYHRLRKNDPTRPILLNLGQGVANDEWKGGWAKPADYRQFVKGCDVVSFDIYPACSSKPNVKGNLALVPRGVDRLYDYSNGRKIVWNILECTRINNPTTKATPKEVKAEVWMSLIHESKGIVYFCHEWRTVPGQEKKKCVSNALLHDDEMREAVGKINKQIADLAPVLNTPTVKDGATVATAGEKAPVDIMVKKHDGAVYLFAVGMKPAATKATFKVAGLQGAAQVEVIGENRTIVVVNGAFADAFGRYDVHLYKIAAGK